MTKKDFQLLLFFLVFVGFGLSGFFFYAYVEDDRAFRMAAMWFGIPSMALGAYYAYYNVFTRGPKQAHWRKVLGIIGIGIFATLLFVASFAGFVIIWNSNVGLQTKELIQGQIIKVKIPQRKKLLSSYSIDVQDSSGHITVLKVPGENYQVGDSFSHVLNRGCLRLLYGH
jgi:hypothetical protein